MSKPNPKTSNAVLIPGLQPVVPPADAPKQPSEIPAAEMQAISDKGDTDLRFFEYGVAIDAVTDAFLAVQSALQYAANTGRNKELVGIEDYRVGACKTTATSTPAGYADPGPQLVFISRTTGKLVTVQAYPSGAAKGQSLSRFHYATANLLVEAAKVDSPDTNQVADNDTANGG